MTTSYAIRRLREEVGELVAKHEQTRDVDHFAKYARRPIAFMRNVLKCEPWKMQRTMALRVRDKARVVVITANGLGKDWVTARIALWWAYANRGMVLLTGPTMR